MDADEQVVEEVKGSPVFLMRLCTGARHIEVQILADEHRNVAAILELLLYLAATLSYPSNG